MPMGAISSDLRRDLLGMNLASPLMKQAIIVDSKSARCCFVHTLSRLIFIALAQLYSRFEVYLRNFNLLTAVDARRCREDRLAASASFMSASPCCLPTGFRKFRHQVGQSHVRCSLGFPGCISFAADLPVATR